jgi:SAM-dependent methyltransferase
MERSGATGQLVTTDHIPSSRGRDAGSGASAAAPGTFSCVVDTHPLFHLNALRWFASLTRSAGVDPRDLVVHVAGGPRTDVLEYLQAKGVTVREVPPFDARSPPCNKIAAALSLATQGRQGLCVLTDSDVAIFEDPRQIPAPAGKVGMKPVDLARPPLPILESVFAAAGLPPPRLVPLLGQAGVATLAGNGNGGLYLVPGAMLPVVARAWERWARWLLERRELLAAWSLHVDQVAMALALAAEGIETFELDARWNFPLHLPALAGPDPAPPAVIHYHQQVDATGQLSPAGIPALDRRIDEANRAFGEVCREAFPNATFWEWRYLTDPELGSGVGSRGEPLADKRALLSVLLAALRPASVLDVGCGDGEATRGLPMPGYVGLDLSAAAVQRARAGRPDGDHRVGTLADQPHAVQADLTVCLDVLIHQADAAGYHDLVSRLWRSAARALLISGYEHPFRATSPMIHFHEPLSASLRRLDPDAAIHPLREVHGITTWLVLKALPDRPADDPRDLPLAAVIELLKQRAERTERIGDLEAKVAACGAEIERWRQRVTAMEATRAWRWRAWLLRWRRGRGD